MSEELPQAKKARLPEILKKIVPSVTFATFHQISPNILKNRSMRPTLTPSERQ